MNNIRSRALVGTFQFSIGLAVLLLLPAWSLRFWQAWVYWLLFTGCVIVITAYLLRYDPALIERRLAAGPGAEQRANQKIIQAAMTVFFVAIFVISGLDHRFHWSTVLPLVVVLSDAFCVLGLGVVFLVFRENSFAAATIKVEAEQRVVESGPYRYVRHPMYAGAVLLLMPTPLALGSLWGLIASVLIFGGIVVRLLDEERFLSANLPGYTDYCQRVRHRLVPMIW